MMKNTPKISVIIPAKDSAETLPRTIESLQKQTYLPTEIIVVINENDNSTRDLQAQIKEGQIKVIVTEAPSHFMRDAQWKRREGGRVATGEVLFFTDSKAFLEVHALAETINLMQTYRKEAVAGAACAWPEQKGFSARLQDAALVKNNPEFPKIGFLNKTNFGKTESLPVTTALAMTRRVFDLVEADFGVDFSASASSYEDYVLAWLVVEKDIEILITNRVISYHKHRTSLKRYFQQIARSGQGAAMLDYRYPQCPLGGRRRKQVLAVLTTVSFTLGTFFGLLLSSNWLAIYILSLCSLIGYSLLAIGNVLKAQRLDGVLMPFFTILLILNFSLHFLKSWLKRGRQSVFELQQYVQIN